MYMTSTKPFFMSPWGCRELPLGRYCIVGMPGGICKKYSETFVKENLDAMWKNCACVLSDMTKTSQKSSQESFVNPNDTLLCRCGYSPVDWYSRFSERKKL